MANEERTIVIKRIKKVAGGHHGGAWKIAYADFVTAMMAFFLLMWLLSSKPEEEREEIARYFNQPLIESILGTAGTASGGDATPSVMPAAGMDLIVVEGDADRGESRAQAEGRTELERREAASLESLMRDIEEAIESDEILKELRNQILLDLTSEGLRIQIVDAQNRPMFVSGGRQPLPHAEQLLRAIGGSLSSSKHQVSISGHTDSAPYASVNRNYGNWELSGDRANAARRSLEAGGLRENQVLRIVGLGSAVPLRPSVPTDPINRRIAIVVLNKSARAEIVKDGGLAKPRTAPATTPAAANPEATAEPAEAGALPATEAHAIEPAARVEAGSEPALQEVPSPH